ncbi:protease HtpX [Amphritea japonica]|uniref:Protease HtpX n=1 Tax=Amphritea japonica ATCC BAA-1530 TaxID=1278309 RepID=A0A7R6P3U6_9GAMM|nr:protease HtpX [Amphritea japonica]BBB26539.1 heat shock protein HtpX [Amphritea japonica ATCC BAA-1530]
MMRIGLFFLTNLAVILLLSIGLSFFGVGSSLQANGIDLDLGNLLIICTVFGFAGSIISLLLSKFMAKSGTGTEIITQARNADEQWLLDTVKELADKAQIGMPEVGIFPAQQANAFATGWNKNSALVAVSLGLLQRFRKEEIKAVLAHEIGHVANGDMVTLALIQGVVNTFVMFFARIIGHFVDRVILKNEQGHGIGYLITTIVAQIVLGVLASTIVCWFSRRREFKADEAGASLASPHAMIGALQRLKAEYNVPDQMPETLTAFGISSHMKDGLMALMASHPPLDDRIAALQSR